MQLHFKFDKNHNYSEENFVVSESNEDAFDFITHLNKCGLYSKFFAIIGESGAGKTHLANILKNRIGAKFLNLEEFKNQSTERFYKNLSKIIQKDRAYILDGIEGTDEESLLYIVNLIENKNAKLLMTSRKNLESLNFQIPDLKSRISNVASFEIKLPNKRLVKAIIVKYLSEHQIAVDDFTIKYMLPRIERSFLFIRKFINAIDEELKKGGKKASIFTIKKVLDSLEK